MFEEVVSQMGSWDKDTWNTVMLSDVPRRSLAAGKPREGPGVLVPSPMARWVPDGS